MTQESIEYRGFKVEPRLIEALRDFGYSIKGNLGRGISMIETPYLFKERVSLFNVNKDSGEIIEAKGLPASLSHLLGYWKNGFRFTRDDPDLIVRQKETVAKPYVIEESDKRDITPTLSKGIIQRKTSPMNGEVKWQPPKGEKPQKKAK